MEVFGPAISALCSIHSMSTTAELESLHSEVCKHLTTLFLHPRSSQHQFPNPFRHCSPSLARPCQQILQEAVQTKALPMR